MSCEESARGVIAVPFASLVTRLAICADRWSRGKAVEPLLTLHSIIGGPTFIVDIIMALMMVSDPLSEATHNAKRSD